MGMIFQRFSMTLVQENPRLFTVNRSASGPRMWLSEQKEFEVFS
jgi:hypothetical protein